MHEQPEQPLTNLIGDLSPDDRRLLHILLQNHADVYRASAATNIPILDFLLWYEKPAIRAAIDTLNSLSAKTLEIRANRARLTAIELLEHAALHTTDPTERRRTLTSLVRATTCGAGFQPARSPRQSTTLRNRAGTSDTPTENARPPISLSRLSPFDDPAPTDTQPTDTPAHTHNNGTHRPEQPTDFSNLAPHTAPASLLTALTTALAHNDEPEPDTGLTLLHAASAGTLILDKEPLPEPLEEFIAAAHNTPLSQLLNHTTRFGIDLIDKTENAQLFAASILPAATTTENPPPIRFFFNFARAPRTESQPPGPWHLTHLFTQTVPP